MSSFEENEQTESAKALIQAYLREHLPVYTELCQVRDAVGRNFHLPRHTSHHSPVL